MGSESRCCRSHKAWVSTRFKMLKEWARGKMPTYHVPTVLKVLDALPKNVMGKVNKIELKNTVFFKELKEVL